MRTHAATAVQPLAGALLRDAVDTALDAGERFAGAWATRTHWHVALSGGAGTRVLRCARDEAPPSIVDLVPAADWDEREARDRHGLRLDGHEPSRALIDHSQPLAQWTVDVSGPGVHDVAVGPIHAGIIESGHFRFHVVGERILALDPQLFFKHRGLEDAAAGAAPDAALVLAGRACAACHVANSVACAQAVEDALGLWPEPELARARTLLLELERLYNHLHDIGAICAGVGFAAGTMAFAALKERAQRLIAELCGHRFAFGSVAVAGSTLALDDDAADRARALLRELRVDARAAWRELEFAGSVRARLDGIGVLAHDDAERFGASGPAARAAGVARDTRTASPRLAYDGLVPARPRRADGDVAARTDMRAAELTQTFELLDVLLVTALSPARAVAARAPARHGIARVESPRGATLCAVELDRSTIASLHLRTGSYANWPALAHAVAGELLGDFPLINKSFELCYACVDR